MTDEEHRAQKAKWQRKYRATHPEEEKHYRATHKAKCAAGQKGYRVAHPELMAKRAAERKEYRGAHPELKTVHVVEQARYRAKYPDKMQIMGRIQNAKRRTLGFIPLNAWFIGCEGHHVDSVYAIYIPKALHCSVSHNVWTGKNMDKINALAYEWLARN